MDIDIFRRYNDGPTKVGNGKGKGPSGTKLGIGLNEGDGLFLIDGFDNRQALFIDFHIESTRVGPESQLRLTLFLDLIQLGEKARLPLVDIPFKCTGRCGEFINLSVDMHGVLLAVMDASVFFEPSYPLSRRRSGQRRYH